MEETKEYTVDMPTVDEGLETTPSKREMGRVFSRMALGLCLGLLARSLAQCRNKKLLKKILRILL